MEQKTSRPMTGSSDDLFYSQKMFGLLQKLSSSFGINVILLPPKLRYSKLVISPISVGIDKIWLSDKSRYSKLVKHAISLGIVVISAFSIKNHY